MTKTKLTSLERAARDAWQAWGDYAQFCICGGCGLFVYCRRHRRGPWLCLDCYDQKEA